MALTGYGGMREEMREILKVLFFAERWWTDEFNDPAIGFLEGPAS